MKFQKGIPIAKDHLRIIIRLFSCAALLYLVCITGSAEPSPDETRFFSYERFFLREDVLARIPGDSRARKDLDKFAVFFTSGIYEISAGRFKRAKELLLEAGNIWPEYFGTDFLLGYIYEKAGDYKTAARYYKSYLKKLKRLQEGSYRISGAFIRAIVSYDIESYDFAYTLLKKRMAFYGIDLDRARPVITVPGFISYLMLFILFGCIYVVIHWYVGPYYRKKQKIANPPEGFWVCPRCVTYNPRLSKECEECGHQQK